MSAESEAQMQQFRQAVYERLVNPGTALNCRPKVRLNSVQSRFEIGS